MVNFVFFIWTLVMTASLATRPLMGSDCSPDRITFYPKKGPAQGVTLHGRRDPSSNTSSYLGIPFGAAPVGTGRFAPPKSPAWESTSFDAKKIPQACLQTNPALAPNGTSEDCLTLNVMTPSGTSLDNASLPVLVYFYGGGFETGNSVDFNLSRTMDYARSIGSPFISVNPNYRLGILGFPNGPDFSATGSRNLGLLDAIAALRWVHQNIWAFGGDPQKVVIAGHSAGAILSSLLYFQEENRNLFRGAILAAGAPSVLPIPSGVFLNASTIYSPTDFANPWLPSVDGLLLKAKPAELLKTGRFYGKPTLVYNALDEGTLFAAVIPDNATSTDAIAQKIGVTNGTQIARLDELYSYDPSEGSPYRTGNETFGRSASYKRAAAMLGDYRFQSSHFQFVSNHVQHYPQVPLYDLSWEHNVTGKPALISPEALVPPVLGVMHTSDASYVARLSHVYPQFNAGDRSIGQLMQNIWINFIHHLDPNGPGIPIWTTYDTVRKSTLRVKLDEVAIIEKPYEEEKLSFWNEVK